MKVVGYVRVSTEEQASEGVSLAAQEAKLRQYAALYDLQLVTVIVDAGQSAKSLNRPGLQQALAMLNQGEAEGLLIAKLDRLTRSVRDLGNLLDGYFRSRCSLLSVADQIDTRSAAGRLMLNLLTSVAEWEREAIGERTSAAMQHLKSQGKHVGRPRAAMESARERAQALRDGGMTLAQVGLALEAEGVLTPAGKASWTAQQVRRLLVEAA